MNLRSLLIVFSFILAINSFRAQVFPYLNASTGNEGQYVVDADTNVYMYHGNQLEKYDKNFNSIWIKSYSGLNFSNLLLSKTGSLYFISKNGTTSYNNIVGKLNSDGGLNWCKEFHTAAASNSEYFCQLLLDRNNNLAISGSNNAMLKKAWFLQLDTLGTILSSKLFDTPLVTFDKFVITEDSSGIYRFIGDFWAFESGGIMALRFNDVLDSMLNYGVSSVVGQHEQIALKYFYKSKYDPSVYYSFHRVTNFNGLPYGYIIKYRNDSIVWGLDFNIPNTYKIDSFDEDEFGSVFYTISCGYCTSYALANSSTKINSNCTISQSTQYFYGYVFSPVINTSEIKGKIHALYGNNYFYDLSGPSFSVNPLYVAPLDSNLNSSCTTGTISTISSLSGGNFMHSNYNLNLQVMNDSSTFNNLFPTGTTISGFSINSNYCSIVSLQEQKAGNQFLNIHPNPTSSLLNISSNFNIISLMVFDVTGKTLLIQNHQKTINIADLNPGIYFIKVKTDQGEFSQKFIKE